MKLQNILLDCVKLKLYWIGIIGDF